MKRITIRSLLLITLALNFGIQVQSLQKINFAKGKSSATVKGSTGDYGATFVVRAKSGQKLTLSLTPVSTVGIRVETDGAEGQEVLLREERGGNFEVGLEETSDYTIFIGSTTGRPVSFTLTVMINRMTDV